MLQFYQRLKEYKENRRVYKMSYLELKSINPVRSYSTRKNMIKPQHDFVHCACTESIQKHIPEIMKKITYQKAKLQPVVVIRDYDVNTEQVYRLVDVDPYDLDYPISIQCTCDNWTHDAIKSGIFSSPEHITIEIEHEKVRREQHRHEELEEELRKQLQEEKESKLWYKVKTQVNKKLNSIGQYILEIEGG